MAKAMSNRLIVLQSDFTYKEGAVAAMHGVIKNVDCELEVFDASHEIPKFDSWSASYRLTQYVRFWPEGTVFVSVVDPTVGTDRRASLAVTDEGYYILAPDNGSFHHIHKSQGISRIYEIDIQKHRLRGYGTDRVSVFHGRDVFAYVAALLASEQLSPDDVGSEYSKSEIVCFEEVIPDVIDKGVKGIFEIVDPNFGNLWTNIPIEMFSEAGFAFGDKILTEISHNQKGVFCKKVCFQPSFGYVENNSLVIYQNEMMKIALALNLGNLVEEYSLGYGPEWEVSFRHE